MTILNAYDIIQACCEQNKPMKRSLKFFCGNEYFKYVIDSKGHMKLSVEARGKNYFKVKKILDPIFVSKLCANLSVSAVWLWEEFRKD